MPEYLSPGVYVEEVSTGPRPIEGVSTSTAGFAGFTERGPTSPKLVTSWPDYTRWFGGYVDDLPGAAGQCQDKYLPYAVRGFFDNGGQRLFIARVLGQNAFANLGNANLGPALVTANGPGEWSGNVRLKVVRASATSPAAANWFRLLVLYYRRGMPPGALDPTDPTIPPGPNKVTPDVLEDFDNLSINRTATNFAETIVNAQSKLVRLDNVTGPVGPTNGLVAMSAGTHDDPRALPDFTFEDPNDINNNRGLAALATIDEIAILAVPGELAVPGLTGEVIKQCELLKDRFAVLNGPENTGDVQNVNPPDDSTYAAIYYPWIRIVAPHTAEGDILVPPCGHVVGIYARTDVDRGVHKAPANEVVRGIVTTDLPINKRPLRFIIDKRKHDILNPKGVNVIRDFRSDGRGIRVWGARTISSDPLWRYVSVRRLFIFVEESIDEGTQWVVFEPNYELTWQAVQLSITGFLRSVWRSGGLAGVTQDEAFFVKCDRTTMTQDDIDNGRLICLIGIAPVKPAEFVIFRISQKTIEAQTS